MRKPDGEVVRRLSGPTGTGPIHRVTGDLTHSPPPTDEDDDGEDREGVVEPDTILPELEYPLDPKGPFVRPGTYTVTLKAGDARATESVEVRGDPEIGLMAEQWRTREVLLDVLDAQRAAFHAAERVDSLHQHLTARRDTLEAEGASVADDLAALVDSAEARAGELEDLRGEIYGLAGTFNWSFVTQPSLRPSTPTHRRRFDALKSRLQRARQALEDVATEARSELGSRR